jgi:hypothetical protein
MRLTTLVLMFFLAFSASAYATGPFMIEGQLMLAVSRGDTRSVENLLYGNIVSSRVLGRALLATLTKLASDYERRAQRVAQLLMAKGADVNYCEDDGRTPLMEACRKRFETVVEGLLAYGADLRARDAVGRDVWDYLDEGRGDVSTVLWAINSADTARRERLEASTVKNLRAYLKNGIVVVHYDLEATGPVPVMLLGSDDDGRTYRLNIHAVRGHVGEEVAPGVDREIIWEVKDDYPHAKPKAITLDVVVSMK